MLGLYLKLQAIRKRKGAAFKKCTYDDKGRKKTKNLHQVLPSDEVASSSTSGSWEMPHIPIPEDEELITKGKYDIKIITGTNFNFKKKL